MDCLDYDGDYNGTLLFVLPGLQIGQCRGICALLSNCQVFTLNASSLTCYLRSTADSRFSAPGKFKVLRPFQNRLKKNS